MLDRIIIIAALYYMYYHVGGLATTNILRLTAGNTLPVLSTKCVCDSCGHPIGVLDQFPIFSFLFSMGKCKHCGAKIPIFPLYLEITVILGMITVTSLFHFSYLGVMLSFFYYEIVRIIVIAIKGRREEQFAKQYAIAFFTMFLYWLPTMWAAFLYTIV